MYDGTPLTNDTVYVSQGSLAEGHTLVTEVMGSIQDTGVIQNVITTAQILDAEGNDVTNCYKIVKTHGYLTIT